MYYDGAILTVPGTRSSPPAPLPNGSRSYRDRLIDCDEGHKCGNNNGNNPSAEISLAPRTSCIGNQLRVEPNDHGLWNHFLGRQI